MECAYNYIFYNMGGDYIEPIFANMRAADGCRMFERAFLGSRILQKLFFLHWSNRINQKIRLPGKRLWYRRMAGKPFLNGKPTCFVFCEGKYILDDPEFAKYLKKKDSRNKTVILYLDLISKKNYRDFEGIKASVDRVVSYDAGEAKRYGIDHYTGQFYTPIVPIDEPSSFETDVFFVGYAKDRLEEILSVHQRLIDAGIKCDFYVAGVDKEKRTERKGWIYLDHPMPYRESLERLKRSRCVLELVQGDSVAGTLRFCEACVYHRKLLTNWQGSQRQPLYDGRVMQVFSAAEEIDTAFLTAPIPYEAFSEMRNPFERTLAEEIDRILGEERQ